MTMFKLSLSAFSVPAAVIAAGVLFGGPLPAAAHDFKVGSLMIDHPWARATPGQARNGAAYMTIHNGGAAGDRLVSASAEVSQRVELHNHINKDGVMQMREVEAIEVPASGMTELKPGSFHVMFMGLSAPLKEGDSFPLTLTFEQAGDLTVTVNVESVGSMGGMEKMDHGTMDHGDMHHGEGAKTN
ncbi:copper chaperone PCu(A)C [Pelagibius sp.]|uniref:copper chaperone PCu(A)C n=1 Tax=Pelagibius sp. TaxID=1931238 RepID=UPI00261ADFC1|nr:copper chaperone PCu(A)C [Pelagibius sp.]